MANVIIRPEWSLSEKLITPEEIFRNRRRFLRDMGFAGAGLIGASGFAAAKDNKKYYPAKKNVVLSSQLPVGTKSTPPEWIAGYNNFYEFTTEKYYVRHPFYMDKFSIDPWKMRVDGLCKKPLAVGAHDLIGDMGKKGKIDERVQRFRCVEGWSMVVPWTGFSLAELLKMVEPKREAKFVRFTTAYNPKVMPGAARMTNYTWPYQEGLRIPPLKLYERGRPSEAIFQMIEKNVRVPKLVLGDLHANLAALRTGERGFLELVENYGKEDLKTYLEALLDYTEDLVRDEIRSWPDGEYVFQDYIDDDSVDPDSIPIHVKLIRVGYRIVRGCILCPGWKTQREYH